MIAVIQVLIVFSVLGVGLACAKTKWLPANSAPYLANLVIYVGAPAVGLEAMILEERTNQKLQDMLLCAILTIFFTFGIYYFTKFLNKVLKTPHEETGVYQNMLLFSNNGFLGFPLVIAIFGQSSLFLLMIVSTITGFFVYTMGVNNLLRSNLEYDPSVLSTQERMKQIFSFPVVMSIISMAIFVFDLPLDFGFTIDGQVSQPLLEIFSMLGGIMTPVSMIVIGIQLSESNLKQLITNYRLLFFTSIRLIFLPLVVFGIMLLLQLNSWITISTELVLIFTLNFLLPAGVLPSALAEKYTKKGVLAAETVFVTTLFSIITITIWTIIFHLV